MTSDQNNKDDANKTVMFDPQQTEEFRRMARQAKQSMMQGTATPSAPQAPQAPGPASDGGKTMMFSADQMANLRPRTPPMGNQVPPGIQQHAGITQPIHQPVQQPVQRPDTRTQAFAPEEVQRLRESVRSAPARPDGFAPTQMYMPAAAPPSSATNKTEAYTPEQVRSALNQAARSGMGPAPKPQVESAAGQTMVYSVGQSNELKDAFDLLKRQQAMSNAEAEARAAGEALLRGEEPTEVDPRSAGSRGATAVNRAAISQTPTQPSGPGALDITPSAAITQPGARPAIGSAVGSEPDEPISMGGGKKAAIIIVVVLGLCGVLAALHYFGIVPLPFLPTPTP